MQNLAKKKYVPNCKCKKLDIRDNENLKKKICKQCQTVELHSIQEFLKKEQWFKEN